MQLILESIRQIWEQIPLLLGYVVRGNAFPQPLTPQKEQTLLKAMGEGDEEARNQLIEHNLRLVVHVARKYARSGYEMDDLISIGTIGLIKAVNTFDPAKGKPLVSYAARCIENEILMALRAGKKRQNDISLLEPIGTDSEGNALTLMDILGTDGDEITESIEFSFERDMIRGAMEQCLTRQEARIIRLRYGMGERIPRTQQEIAKEMGISRSYVSRIEKHALEKLQQFVTAMPHQ